MNNWGEGIEGYTLILLIVVDRMIQYSKIHIVFKYR